MHSRYDYGKDVRTDQELKEYNIIGKTNQKICIQQFLIEKMIAGLHYTYTEVQEKLYAESDADINNYEPDIRLHTPNGIFWIEIKVQMKPIGENVHIKENQLNKLVQLEGFVLYSTADEYFIHRASFLKANSNGVIFSNRLHKRCYDIESDKLKWNKWLHKPEYYQYPKRNYNGKNTR